MHFENIKSILLDSNKTNLEKLAALNDEANQVLIKKSTLLEHVFNQDEFVNFLMQESSETRVALTAQMKVMKEVCGFTKPSVIAIHQIEQLCVDYPLSPNTLLNVLADIQNALHLAAIKTVEANLAFALNLPKGLNKLLNEIKQKDKSITMIDIKNVLKKHRCGLGYQVSGFFKQHSQENKALYDALLACNDLSDVDAVIDKVYGLLSIKSPQKSAIKMQSFG